MFSSNQVLEVSGNMSQLEMALSFAIRFAGYNRNDLVYQITEDGKYCIGWCGETLEKGWNRFQFDFDVEIVSKIIVQHLRKLPNGESCYDWMDGSTDEGFLMKNIFETFSDKWEGILNPFYGIVSFESFKNFYSK